ncbi:MAG: hypothetical protein AAFR58_24455 [Cyanobacteria bacterium J06627_28]
MGPLNEVLTSQSRGKSIVSAIALNSPYIKSILTQFRSPTTAM